MFRPGQGRDDSILQVKDFLYTLDTEQRIDELDASWNSYRPMRQFLSFEKGKHVDN